MENTFEPLQLNIQGEVQVNTSIDASPLLFNEFCLEPLPYEIEATAQCCVQYGDIIKFPCHNKMDLKHWMQVMLQLYLNALNGTQVLYSEVDLSQQPLLKSRSEIASLKRGQQRSTVLERVPCKRKRFEYTPDELSSKKRSGASFVIPLSSRCLEMVSMFGDFIIPSAISKSCISLVNFLISETDRESSSTDHVNNFEQFLTAQCGTSSLLYFDLLRNTVTFVTECILNHWNSIAHRIACCTLGIVSSPSDVPSVLTIAFPLSLFVDLYRIVLDHSIPLGDQVQSFLLDDLEHSQSPEATQLVLSSISKLLHSALAYCISLMELSF